MGDPATLVLFGATSDLARGRLWPALHDLAASGRLPSDTAVLGISRRAGTEQLRALAAEQESPEAYERLLGDAFAGDTTLFASTAEVEAQWAAVEPVLIDRPDPERYAPGSEGPDGAGEMLARDGRRWRPISG